jgi:hypothetical protein
MNDTREETQDQVEAPPPPKYDHLYSHEDPGELLGYAGGFKAGIGVWEVILNYYVHRQGVLLAAIINPPAAPPRVWLRHWTSHVEAVRSAENIAAEAEAYLSQISGGAPLRETEDLDYEDFIEHLRVRLNNEFH